MRKMFAPAGVLVAVVASVAALATVAVNGQSPAQSAVTFTKDVAPILQRSCQSCHRPGDVAPMSLMTYDEVRPWARAIKQKISDHQMPPWFLDPNIGIQKFKNDPSLSDAEVALISKWVDAGAPMGNMADMPKPKQFDDDAKWHIGTPDLIVTSPPHKVPAEGPDWWGQYYVPSGLTEDRYIMAVESKPGKRAVTHHLLTYAVDPNDMDTSNAADDSALAGGEFLNEYAVGKNGDVFPQDTGRLLKAGSVIKFDFHYHAVGEEQTDQSQLAFKFYPKGYVPKHVVYSRQLAGPQEPLDIPPGAAMVRSDGYTRMNLPGVLTAFQTHMHTRGVKQCLELIYPDNKTEMINCSNFDFAWHIVHVYADDVQPIYPAGTVLHVISWHDNSPASKGNPDPRNWVGSGNRTVDEMGFAWISWYDVTQEEYQAMFDARKKAQQKPSSTQQQGQNQ